MPARPRYRAVHAQTVEALKRHRQLIEDALRDTQLPPKMKAELLHELTMAMRKECKAQSDAAVGADDDEDDDNDDDDKGGGKKDGGSGSGGGPGNAGTMEMLALLFYLAEEKTVDHDMAAQNNNENLIEESLAAATLMFDRAEGIADIAQLYIDETPAQPTPSPREFLPLIEKQAAQAGAHTLYLRALPNAVNTLQKKYGFEPYGKVYYRKGIAMQKMRKRLPGGVKVLGSECV